MLESTLPHIGIPRGMRVREYRATSLDIYCSSALLHHMQSVEAGADARVDGGEVEQ